MTDEPRITAAEAMRRADHLAASIPQHITAARTLEVMQGADARQQRGSNETFHPDVARPTAAQAMREAAEQRRRHDLINAPTADEVTQAATEQQRRRLWLMEGNSDQAAPTQPLQVQSQEQRL